MKYSFLRWAWIGLCIDNVPPQIREPDSHWRFKEPLLEQQFQPEVLSRVDSFIAALCSEDPEKDLLDLESRLWQLVSPESESEADEETDQVLNWMFENLL